MDIQQLMTMMEGNPEKARNDALLQFGLATLANNTSRNPMKALAAGGMAGMQGYNQSIQSQQMDALRKIRMQSMLQGLLKQQQQEKALQGMDVPPEVKSGLIPYAEYWKKQNPDDAYKVVDGSLVKVGNGKAESVFTADQKPPTGMVKGPDGNWMYDPAYLAGQQAIRAAGKSETNVTYGAPVAGVDNSGNPVFFQPSKGGGAPAVVPGVKPEPKEAKSPTEAENKSGIYYKQMKAAEQTIANLEKEGMDMARLWSQAETGVAGTLAGNMVASPRAQMARQAQNQWAEQMLRQQTGAAATEQEVQRTVKTYFPQPGDDKATVDLKRSMRANAMEAVGGAAGKAIKPVDMKSPDKDLPSAVQKFSTLPPAQDFKGRRMKGPDGIYRSNGMSWVKE